MNTSPTPSPPPPFVPALLQLVLDLARHTEHDNADFQLHPAQEPPLTDPADGGGDRLADILAQRDGLEATWRMLGDPPSRHTFLRLLAWRVLGHRHVRLGRPAAEYRQLFRFAQARLLKELAVYRAPELPLEWLWNQYDLRPVGFNLEVVGQVTGIVMTFLARQYEYRSEHAQVGPQPGDTAVDVGSCWGETALWLMERVSPDGAVHAIEPSAANVLFIETNTRLNPDHPTPLRLHQTLVADQPGRRVFLSGVGAGARIAEQAEGPGEWLQTDTLDNLVAVGAIPRVDFLKFDIEGAEEAALAGARTTIGRFIPRLAVAVYHRPDDLVTIPALIRSIDPRYRMYLHAATLTPVDSVAFFAVPPAAGQDIRAAAAESGS